MNIQKWVGNTFESSSGRTEEWVQFAKDFTKYCREVAGSEYEMKISRGHFYMSGFYRNKATGKFVYFSTSDVRHFPDEWYNGILVRTATGWEDYTGGSNHNYKLDQLGEAIDLLTQNGEVAL